MQAREVRSLRRYRLIVKVPITVAFPSVVYRLDFSKVTGPDVWELVAEPVGGRSHWLLAHTGDGKAPVRLAAMVYEGGFDVLHTTVPSTILERLCRDRRAERLAPNSPPR